MGRRLHAEIPGYFAKNGEFLSIGRNPHSPGGAPREVDSEGIFFRKNQGKIHFFIHKALIFREVYSLTFESGCAPMAHRVRWGRMRSFETKFSKNML